MTTAAVVMGRARRRAGLGLRELARRAGTSHATLHAYESGAKDPRVATVERIVEAAGFVLEVSLAPRPDLGEGRLAKGRELVEVLELAAEFPARHHRHLDGPIFAQLEP